MTQEMAQTATIIDTDTNKSSIEKLRDEIGKIL